MSITRHDSLGAAAGLHPLSTRSAEKRARGARNCDESGKRHEPDRRDAERAVPRVGRVRERLLAGQRRARLVLVPDVDEIERMRRRLDVGEVELGDLADGLEDRAELLPHALDLVLGDLEARQPRDVQHVFSA